MMMAPPLNDTVSAPSPLFLCLPHHALLSVLSAVQSPVDVVAFGRCCHEASAIVRSDELWWRLLARAFPERSGVAPSIAARQRFRDLAYSQGGAAACCLARSCGGSLLRPDGSRCPCVASRTRLPLHIGHLHPSRTGTSSLRCGGFSGMLAALGGGFDAVEGEGVSAAVTDLEILSDEALRGLDLVMVCTTEGPPLLPGERDALRRWVEAGGALIVSAFSNWSRYEHYAVTAVGWLGVDPIPDAPFEGPVTHTIEAARIDGDEVVDASSSVSDLLCGPFGAVARVSNYGESIFNVPTACDLGAVSLTRQFRGRNLLERRQAHLLYYPPRSMEAGGVTGRGRVLVCSNYHWLADFWHWNGGLLHRDDNARLLLNFAAIAVAARADRDP